VDKDVFITCPDCNGKASNGFHCDGKSEMHGDEHCTTCACHGYIVNPDGSYVKYWNACKAAEIAPLSVDTWLCMDRPTAP
jgi:hypothetical protein